MGVYIKGLELPKKCIRCIFNSYGQCLANHGKELGSVVANSARDADCPLIPILPHGRLIDADALIKRVHDTNKCAFGTEELLEYSSLSVVLDYVESAPAIIQAEEART